MTNGKPPANAAEWVVRAHSDQRTREDEAALCAWLEADPEAARDYRAHDALWGAIGALADDPEARALLRPASASETMPEPTVRIGRRGLIGALAGLAAAASAAFFLLPGLLDGEQHYETKVGEQRRIQLADGSVVLLNTASRLSVRLGEEERRITLEEGQAFFEVAHDAARPFRVFVGNDEVRALGTAFEVRKLEDRAKVILVQGRVAIYRAAASQAATPTPKSKPATAQAPAAAVLSPGQAATLQPEAPLRVEPVDLTRAQAWRSGKMILDADPLGQAIAEINRYGGKQIMLANPALAAMKISGVFHTTRPETFVESVTLALPLRVVQESDEQILLGRI